MSRMSELIVQAEMENKASPEGQIASFLESALGGFASGRELARKDEENKLSKTLKLLEIQKTQEELKVQAANRKMAENLMKRLGLADLTEPESEAARASAFSGLNGGAKNPKDHTTSGRLASIYIGDEEYNPVPSFSPTKGMSIEFKRAKDSEDKDPTNKHKRVHDTAVDMARREKFNLISSLMGPDEAAKFSNVQPTEDEVQKYIPEAEAYLLGDNEKARSLRTRRKGDSAMVEETIRGLQEQIKKERENETDFVPFNEGNKSSEKLTTRRNKLIQGGGTEEVRAQIVEDINELKQDPKKNREQIVELTKKLIKLSRAGR